VRLVCEYHAFPVLPSRLLKCLHRPSSSDCPDTGPPTAVIIDDHYLGLRSCRVYARYMYALEFEGRRPER
jgi:hypothetical protein